MMQIQFLDNQGTFQLEHPETNSYLYFPLANEAGVMSSVTPQLNGDCKMDQNTFLLAPVSSENLHNDKSSRNFWVYCHGKGAWSATGASAKQQSQLFGADKEQTTLTAGVMWHQLTRTSQAMGLRSTILSFVPAGDDRSERMKITIENISNQPITITPTAAIPIYGRSADNIRDHRHVTSLLHRIQTTRYGVTVTPTLTFDERGHKENHMTYGVLGAQGNGTAPVGFFPVVEQFIGEGGSLEHPKAVVLNQPPQVLEPDRIHGYEAIGGIRFAETTLHSGEQQSYIISLCFGTDQDDFDAMAQQTLNETCFDAMLEQTKQYWNNKLNISYETNQPNFDQWMYWVNFQPILRRIYGCSFLPHHDYGKGGRGWRDLWQDCLALIMMEPDGVREMLLNHYAGIRLDGTNATIIGKEKGTFLADRNNITRVWMDHGAWSFLTTQLYIEQTGDLGFLLAEQTYFKDTHIHRGKSIDNQFDPSCNHKMLTEQHAVYHGTILEHLLVQNLTAFYDVGNHNHLKLHDADWNDALDMAAEQGESVAFSALYAGNLADLAAILKHLQIKRGITTISIAKEIGVLLAEDTAVYDHAEAKQAILADYLNGCESTLSGEKIQVNIDVLVTDLLEKSRWMKQQIRQREWVSDGQNHHWFNGYYDNNGTQVEGSHTNGVRMMLTSQVFTIMNGIATDEQVKEIIASADQYLYDPSIGGYRLNTDFHKQQVDMGRMFGFAYGHKENGAVFCHMTTMYANALYQRGFVREGYRVIDALYQHCADFEKSRIYPGVPEYINQNGRGMYSYLTGTASWLMLTVVTQMFGVKGKLGDLHLSPKLLQEQFAVGKAQVKFVFADRTLCLEYCNPHHLDVHQYEIGELRINGKPYALTEGEPCIKREDITTLEKNGVHTLTAILKQKV